MRTMLRASLIAAIAALPIPSIAQSNVALDLHAGTLGAGAGIGLGLNERLGLRFLGAAGSLNRSVSTSDVEYDGKLKMRNFPVLLDVHPGAGSFRLSAGIVFNDNRIDVTAKPASNATYTFNGVTYTSASVGSATGDVTFNSAAPYLGIGFGRPVAQGRGWGFSGDLGVAYQGTPRTKLSVACGASLNAAQCAQLQSDVAAEQSRVDDKVKSYRWYPVVQLHVFYAF